jgi:hypothetical protein
MEDIGSRPVGRAGNDTPPRRQNELSPRGVTLFVKESVTKQEFDITPDVTS